MVRVLGLHKVALGSNPILTSGLALFRVITDSTQPLVVNNQLVTSCQLGFLIMFRLTLKCFFLIIKNGVPVNYSLSHKCCNTDGNLPPLPLQS